MSAHRDPIAPTIIDDSTGGDLLAPPGLARGLEPGPGYGSAAGYAGYAEPFPAELLVPESEWADRIAERKRRKATCRENAYGRGGVTIKNQQSLPYCWIFATTTALEIARVLEGQPHVPLSPASCGAKITGYRRRGGYGREAIDGLIKYGAAPSALWPDTAVNRQHDTPEARAAAEKYRVDEWVYLETWPEVVSYMLRTGGAVSAGYNWWMHQVCLVDLDVLDGEVCPVLANSWSTQWGTEGFGTLQGRRKIPADAVAPRTALAT